jgi:hypothetical protein
LPAREPNHEIGSESHHDVVPPVGDHPHWQIGEVRLLLDKQTANHFLVDLQLCCRGWHQ